MYCVETKSRNLLWTSWNKRTLNKRNNELYNSCISINSLFMVGLFQLRLTAIVRISSYKTKGENVFQFLFLENNSRDYLFRLIPNIKALTNLGTVWKKNYFVFEKIFISLFECWFFLLLSILFYKFLLLNVFNFLIELLYKFFNEIRYYMFLWFMLIYYKNYGVH